MVWQVSLNSARPANAPTFAGTYEDTKGHPGCFRKIIRSGKAAIITGADEDGAPWKITATPDGKNLLCDFSSKGGPKDVVGVWNGLGIVFPDGNFWKKV